MRPTISSELLVTTGTSQVCAGVLRASFEAAASALTSVFIESETEGVLLVDASNAFSDLKKIPCFGEHLC